MIREFAMGDTVRISKKSIYYGIHETSNPADMDGQIIRIDYDHIDRGNGIAVRWDNGDTNTYNTSDLKMRQNGGNHGRA